MKNLIIIGAGGLAKEVALIVHQINSLKKTWNIIGFIDDNKENKGKIINGIEILGGIEKLKNYDESHYIIVAIANCKVRRRIVEELKGKFKFATIIHPNFKVHDFMTIGEGVIIYDGVIITSNVTIGNHVIISPKCGIGHDSVIKDYVSLLWNVNISGADIIEEEVLIGSAATVIQNKTIGNGSIIGAGAVVINDVNPNSTMVGVPAKCIKREGCNEKDIVCNHN